MSQSTIEQYDLLPAANFFKKHEKLAVRKRFDCLYNPYYELRIYEGVYDDSGYFIGQKNFKTVGKILNSNGFGEVTYSPRFLKQRPEFTNIVLSRLQYGKFYAREVEVNTHNIENEASIDSLQFQAS